MIVLDDAPAVMERYLAKADCRAAGRFRRAGEEFEMPKLKSVPAHLEALGANSSGLEEAEGAASTDCEDSPSGKPKPAGKPKKGKPAPVPKAARVSGRDLGMGAVTLVQDVTSADMVTR